MKFNHTMPINIEFHKQKCEMLEEIITRFSPLETKAFTATLTQSKRSKALFFALKENSEKEFVFYKVYKKKYSPENDYLLRAEKKILKKKIENFIYSNSNKVTRFNKSYSIYYEMCRWCYKNDLLHVAYKYIQKSYQIAAEEEDLADMLKINRLWFLILFQLNIPLKEKSKILYERLKIKEELIKKQATEEYRHLQFLESSIEKLNRSIGETYTEKPLEKEKTIIFEESDTALSSYFYHKTLAFKDSTLDPIAELKKAIEIFEKTPDFYFKSTEKIAIEGALATEYSKRNQLVEACEVYEKLIHYPQLLESIASPSIHFNYISTLLKGENYHKAEEVLKILESRHPQFSNNALYLSMKVNTYLFLEDVSKLKSAFKQKQRIADNNVKTYHRFLQYLYYLLKGDLDIAEREIANIKKSKIAKESVFYPLIDIFKMYNDFLLERSEKKLQAREKILDKIEDLNKYSDGLINHSLPVKWIMKHL